MACPFCREMFDPRERRSCVVCGVALVKLGDLPPRADDESEPADVAEGDDRTLPLGYLGRGRGVLAALACGGLLAFLLPWVHVTLPDVVDYSGFDLARRLGWTWGAGVAWFVLLPTVVTRRSVTQMRGARVAAAFLAAVPATTVVVLLSRPPHGSHGVPLRFSFGEGLYASLALSAIALAFAVRFGGRRDTAARRRTASQAVH